MPEMPKNLWIWLVHGTYKARGNFSEAQSAAVIDGAVYGTRNKFPIKYIPSTPAREHAEETRDTLEKVENLAIKYDYGRSGIKYEIPPSVWRSIRKLLATIEKEEKK